MIRKIEVDGSEIGIITRNRYGALVLNTSGVLFADIDIPETKSKGFIDALLLMFSKKSREDKRKKQEPF